MSRTSWKQRRFRPANMPARRVAGRTPVEHDLHGLLRALLDEKEAILGTRMRATSIEDGLRDLRLVRLHRECVNQLREDMLGWTAYGPASGTVKGFEGAPTPGMDWWSGEVVNVDFDHQSLVVALEGGKPPRAGGVFFLKEPDYQEQVRRWALKRIELGRATPDAPYLHLVAGDLRQFACGGPGRDQLDPHLERFGLRAPQLAAGRGAASPLSLIWGPPGTGKTFTLGAMVATLSLLDVKVLVLAPTNVAVDQACLAIDDARTRLGNPLLLGELIRAGRPQLPQLEERKHLMAWSQILEQHSTKVRSLRLTIGVLEKRLSAKTGAERDRANLELGEVRKRLQDLEVSRAQLLWRLAQNATVIATTLTAGLAHEAIRESLAHRRYALVIDEASMVPRFVLPPFLEHAPAHLTLAGDFRQLGPVKRNSDHENENCTWWVGQSAFQAAGLRTEADIARLEGAGALHMLVHQSRMNEGLCSPVSDLYYAGRLVTVGEPPAPPAASGWPAHSCLVVNPDKVPVPHFAPPGVDLDRQSRENRWEKSAWIAIGIAEAMLREDPDKSVLLLSPFRNQADLLRKLARAHLSSYPHVRAGTVHTSQGNEADLVIFDPVHPRHGWLIQRFGAGDAPRLFCVAFSRPRQQVVLLARRAEVVDNRDLKLLARDGVDWQPWGAAMQTHRRS